MVTGLRPYEFFCAVDLKTRFSLISPNLTPTIEKQQEKQKAVHEGKRNFFKGGESLGVQQKR